MRKTLVLIGLMLLTVPLSAQGVPKYEFFGGYSYLRSDFSQTDHGYHGWNFAMTQNVNNWFAGVLDISGHYAQPNGFNANFHSFMYGVQLTARHSGGVHPFAQAMLGAVRGSRAYLGLSESKVEFGAAFGGGVDVRVNKRVSYRVVQADYLITPFLGVRQDNLRLSTGLVFHWGEK